MKNRNTIKAIAVIIIFVVAAGSTGCSRFKAPKGPLDFDIYSPEGALSPQRQYRIGVRDKLEIMVWRCPELDTEDIVRPGDGSISMKLVGDVKANGLTPKELAEEISNRLAYYVKDPRIAVRVKAFGTKKVFCLGKVKAPGGYDLEREGRVINLLGYARGIDPHSEPSCAYIIRGGYYDHQVIRINLGRLLYKGDMTQNIYLMEGDILYVPQNEIENFNLAIADIIPSLYLSERVATLRNNVVNGSFDWNDVWKRGHRGF